MSHLVRLTMQLAIMFNIVLFPLCAQQQTGTPPLASLTGGPDIVNLSNLNFEWRIPVIHKAGRATPFLFDLDLNSSVWYVVTSGSTHSWQPTTGYSQPTTATLLGTTSSSARQTVCNGNSRIPLTIYSNWTYTDPGGTSHPFGFSTWGQTSTPCSTTSASGVATDGSGYTLSVTGGAAQQVKTPDGTVINFGTSTLTDRNGNQIVNWTDTLGTVALSQTGTVSSPPVVYTYSAPGSNGAGTPANVTLSYKSYTVRSNFGCTGITEFGPLSEPLIDRITLADGSFYQFQYEPTPGFSGDVTARIASVTVPTQGTISYVYSGGTGNGINCSDSSVSTLTRTTPDGRWIYAHASGSGAASTTTVTDSQNNQTVLQFQGLYEAQRQVYQGSSTSGTLLQTANTCYNGSSSPCTGTAVTVPISERAVISQFGSSGLASEHVDFYNSYGLIKETDDYDFGSGGPGPLLKKTSINYNTSLGNNIVDKPSSITVQDGAGNTLSNTSFSYDQGTLAPTTGTPQHISITGSRGNLTGINYYTQGSTFLTKTFTYFDTGNVQTITDVNGAVTTNTYSSANCPNSFPTGVAEPLSLSRTLTWNCTGGVQTSLTDENNQTTTYTYNDADFWRINAVTDPL
jgi:hypothetical protein